MLKNLQHFQGNTLTLQVIGGFNTADMQQFAQLFHEKRQQGFQTINLYIDLSQLSLRQSSLKAGFAERIWGLKNCQAMRHIAIVGQSSQIFWLKPIVKMETWIIQAINPIAKERFFTTQQLHEALSFVNPNEDCPNN